MTDKPNILVIMADQLAPQALSQTSILGVSLPDIIEARDGTHNG